MTKPVWLDDALSNVGEMPAISQGILVGALRQVEGLHFDVAILCHLLAQPELDSKLIEVHLKDALSGLAGVLHRLERLAHLK